MLQKGLSLKNHNVYQSRKFYKDFFIIIIFPMLKKGK